MELNMDFKFRNPVSRIFVKKLFLKNPLFVESKSHFSPDDLKSNFLKFFQRFIVSIRNMYFRKIIPLRSLKCACEFSLN